MSTITLNGIDYQILGFQTKATETKDGRLNLAKLLENKKRFHLIKKNGGRVLFYVVFNEKTGNFGRVCHSGVKLEADDLDGYVEKLQKVGVTVISE